MERFLNIFLKWLFRLWVVLIVVLIGVQLGIHLDRKGDRRWAMGDRDNEAEGLKSIRKYMAVQEFLQDIAPKKKGEVVFIGLEDGRVLKARLIKEK